MSKSTGILAIVLAIVGMAAAHLCAQPIDLLRCDFSKDVTESPCLDVVGDASVEGGVLKSSSLANWQRSGLSVGPVPVSDAPLFVEYDMRPVKLGRQCQEFASQTPSTHWYMVFVSSDGRMRLYTRLKNEWKPRVASEAKCEAGKWYRVSVALRRTSLAFRIADRETGAELWQAGPIEMDDIGKETVFALIDEAPASGEGATEWDNLTIKADDATLARLWKERQEELEKERQDRVRREKQIADMRALGLALIPTPQEIAFNEGKFILGDGTGVTVSGGAPTEAADIVRNVIAERTGVELVAGKDGIVVSAPKDKGDALWQKEQSYKLIVSPTGVRIEAASPVGFFYAAQTLAQLVRQDRSMPCVEIRDWPAIANRLVMIAVSQGAFQVIDVEYWKRIIRELAAVKINAIMPYFEGGTFYYERYPFLGLKGRDGFTVEKGKILSEYAHRYFIEMVPQQEGLGHSGTTLGHAETKNLREEGGTFCSSKPEVFAFLGDLFDELVAAFPYARHIHVGGDEFGHNFAKCPLCKARAEEIGKDGLYAEHMMKLRKMLADRKRGMMIWWHEQGFTESAAGRLAKDIVVFDWHYGNQRDYPSLDKLLKLGFTETWATPAITRYYNTHADDWHDTFGNIQGFMKAGLKRNVPGECTCTWVHGIWGGRNLFELNLYGLLFSGECSWNPLAASQEDFMRKFAMHWFGLEGDDLGQQALQAIHAPYGERKEQKFWRDCRCLEPILGDPPKATAKMIKENPALVEEAKGLLAFCDRGDKSLDQLRKEARRNTATIDFLKYDVHMHRAAARRILCMAEVLQWRERTAITPPDKLIPPLEELVRDYDRMEAMFKRSVKEAGGGECELSTAKGGIRFRVYKGKEGIEKLIEHLKKGAYDEDL